jgi:hypothetical protein
MNARAYLNVTLLVSLPCWAQVVPTATSGDATRDAGYQMSVPPTVSGEAYPSITAAEVRSNYLRTSLAVTAAYNDNVLPDNGATPISDVLYSVAPTVALDRATPKMHETFSYSPGFTFYQRTSALNAADQNGSLNMKYHFSPYLAIGISDSVYKSSNVFNQTYGGILGTASASTATVVAPYLDQIGNNANAVLSYQFGKNAMVGASGTSGIANYSDQSQATGLANSNSRGGLAFYNYRIGGGQYVGAAYQYSYMQSTSETEESDTQLHSLYPFYMINLKNALSISIAGGEQKYTVTGLSLQAHGSWTPTVVASMGLQKNHVNYAASFSRTVMGNSGVLGTYHSNSASALARWKLAQSFAVSSQASYFIQKNVLLSSLVTGQNGHTVSGSCSAEYTFGEHLTLIAGYQRLHQSYNGVAVIAIAPNANREFISFTYTFSRPLGK